MFVNLNLLFGLATNFVVDNILRVRVNGIQVLKNSNIVSES